MSESFQKLNDVIQNFILALDSLVEASKRDLKDPVITAGVIQNFEFSYELSWRALKRLLEIGGHPTQMSRDVYSKAFQLNLISNEKLWLKMIEDRNATVHTYDKPFASQVVQRVVKDYIPLLIELKKLLLEKKNEYSK